MLVRRRVVASCAAGMLRQHGRAGGNEDGLQARRLAFKSHFERDDVERELLGGPRGGTGSAGSSGICHERTRSPSSRNRSTAGPLLLLRVMAGTSEL